MICDRVAGGFNCLRGAGGDLCGWFPRKESYDGGFWKEISDHEIHKYNFYYLYLVYKVSLMKLKAAMARSAGFLGT